MAPVMAGSGMQPHQGRSPCGWETTEGGSRRLGASKAGLGLNACRFKEALRDPGPCLRQGTGGTR